jgi:hypothetical protein
LWCDDDPNVPERRGEDKAQATSLPPDWRPGVRVIEWATKQGMTPEWVAAQIDEFVVYWRDTGERRKSWDATFIRRLHTLQANESNGQDHEPERRLADKDYRRGATPLEQIPWIRRATDG